MFTDYKDGHLKTFCTAYNKHGQIERFKISNILPKIIVRKFRPVV
jgi:hypothetical protein